MLGTLAMVVCVIGIFAGVSRVLLNPTLDAPHRDPSVASMIVGPAPCQCIGRRKKRKQKPERSTEPVVIAGSYSRFSSDQQRDESILDQQRKCHEAAQANGHTIAPEHEYQDEAVSGTKRQRKGLDAMLAAAKSGELNVLYLFSLSRLARELAISVPILKRLVHVDNVRVISVSEGVDSARHGWEVVATVLSLLHERYIAELSSNVFRGQEGTVLANFALSDYPFGYKTVPVLGSDGGRKGRGAKPRRMYAIDEVTAPWVVKIFSWFVIERRSIGWITAELNRNRVPKDHRASTTKWYHQQVTRLLGNEKYTGRNWRWGEMKNVRDPETGKLHQEDRSEEECAKWIRQFPHLRLIDDAMFDAAQELLDENARRAEGCRTDKGRLTGSKPDAPSGSPRHLLERLIKCGEPSLQREGETCHATFRVAGVNGKYLRCTDYGNGVCACKTQLPRKLAEEKILAAIGAKILNDPTKFELVLAELQESWQHFKEQVPADLAALQSQLADIDRGIGRLVDRIEAGVTSDELEQKLEERCAQRREERWELVQKIDQLQRKSQRNYPEPTPAWLTEQLHQLHDVLHGDIPAAAVALRNLVGGKITVTVQQHPRLKRNYFQGRFVLRTHNVLRTLGAECMDVAAVPEGELHGEEIIVDFVEDDEFIRLSDEAFRLYETKIMNAEIARRLGKKRGYVTKLLHYAFKSRGLTMPDGRGRRAELAQKHVEPPLYQKISDEVKRLADQGLLLQEIAEQLGCDRNTVSAALRYWYESHGLEVPDGRSRRKQLDRKVSPSRPDDPTEEPPSD